MKKKRLLLIALLLLTYCALVFGLLKAETGWDPSGKDVTISTPAEAIWYSIVTMTTVGYGDIVPRSPAGRFIGGIFLLLSLGFLTTIVSLAITLVRGSFLPTVQLMLQRKKHWYVFPLITPESIALARRFSDETVVFLRKSGEPSAELPGIAIESTAASLASIAKGGMTFFVFGEDSLVNMQLSDQLKAYGKVYCGSDLVQNTPDQNIDYMNPSSACARMFWQSCPLQPQEKQIVLIGGKRWLPQLLHQALLVNVLDVNSSLRYHIFGDEGAFLADHPYLGDCFGINMDIPDKDSLYFHGVQPEAEILLTADRIILCLDSDRENIAMFFRIRRFFPSRAELYLHLNQPIDGLQAVQFGAWNSLFTPENILHHQLDAAAIAQNERYNQRNPENAAAWEDLSDYARGSNLASADHQAVKVRLLLNDFSITEPTTEQRRMAARAFQLQKNEKQDFFRELEHLRWERYLYLNNWRHGKRDQPLRFHPLLCPFSELPPDEKANDDDAWLSLSD